MDKVLEALYNCIRTPKCLDCPWESCEELDIEKVEIPRNLACDVYAMLKAQEPKVMTLEELKALDGTEHCVWVEDNGCDDCFNGYAGIITSYIYGNVELISFGNEVSSEPDNTEYGKTWRCWSARPTDEQRKAVKWDG